MHNSQKMSAAIFALTVSLAGCTNSAVDADALAAAAIAKAEQHTPEWRGEKFVRNRCADCHALEAAQSSPLPAAPSFEAIANTPQLTRQSLTIWLKKPHNFPDQMYFEIPQEHIDDLVAYVLTLRSDDYEPSIGLRMDSATHERIAVSRPQEAG